MPRAFPAGSVIVGLSVCILYIGIPTWLSHYDAATKKRVLQTVKEELPPRASMAQMNGFMRRHTGRYGFDPYDFQFAGSLPQTTADEFLMSRSVDVVLKVNRGSKTFKNAEVETSYTFL